jgi:hypothetical protein
MIKKLFKWWQKRELRKKIKRRLEIGKKEGKNNGYF